MKASRTRSAWPASLAIVLCIACSKNAAIKGTAASLDEPGGKAAAKATGKPGQAGGAEETAWLAPGLEKSKRKTLPLLKSSILNCLEVDEKIFALDNGMIAEKSQAPKPDDKGRVAFLAPKYNIAGDNTTVIKSVLETEQPFLDDPASLRRASLYGSALDDLPYMVASSTVANVVAWNADPAKLDCAGTPAARAFLERCLLGEEDIILDEAATQLGAKAACGAADPFSKRKALATLLASYLFLRVR